MGFQNRIQTNFARGEVGPSVQSRPDLAIALSSLKLCHNFIPKFEGGVAYAPGTTYITAASVTAGAVLVPFVYRDSQAFQFEIFIDSSFDLNIRILKDNGVLLYSAGNLGWTVNDALGAGTTDSELIGFQGGVGKDPSVITAGVAGAEVTMTVAGTFAAADLQNLRYAQSGAAMIIAVEGKFCIQIWRGATTETAWAINEASVISSSFITITSIADDDNGFAEYLTAQVHGLVVGDIAIIRNTDNDNNMDGAFKVTEIADTTHFTTGQEFLATSTGEVKKGGTFHDFVFAFEQVTDFMTIAANIPKEVKFNDGRLYFVLDDKMYGSRSVVDGQDMYTNYTQSITPLATDAVEFTASISSDKVDLFKWLKVSNKAFYAGMENLIATITGETAADPIAGDSIKMQSSEDRGSSDVPPIEDGKDIIFVDSTGKRVNSFAFDLLQDSEQSKDLSILNKHMFAETTIKKIVFQRGLIDIVWVLLANGKLVGFIFNSSENITGWFWYLDAKDDNFKDISVSPVSNGIDRLWTIVARSDGSTGTIDQVEQLEIPTVFQRIEDFFSIDTETGRVEDLRRWQNAIYEQQKEAVHMHSMLTLNTFDTTLAAGTYLHFNAELNEIFISSAGTTATKLTGSNSPLNGEADNNVVIKATTAGLGEGIFSIDDYISNTGISTITEKVELADYTFDAVEAAFIISPGSWGISFSSITSASLERYFDSTGAIIDVVLDGSPAANITIVESGGLFTADLGNLSGNVIYFGYIYAGVIATLPVNFGGSRGTGFAKLKNIDNVRIDFLDSVNLKYGIDLYNLNELDFRIGSDRTDRPIPVQTKILELPNPNGSWENKMVLYIVQDVPVPLEILSIDIAGDVEDE